MNEVAYLNEVKFRNQLRRDLQGRYIGSVANKADRYRKGYIHVEPVFSQPEWFKIHYYGYSDDTARTIRLFQTLHLLGYEVKFVKGLDWLNRDAETAVYRKRA
jgi:hypothetical protein